MPWRNLDPYSVFQSVFEWGVVVFLALFGGRVRSCLKPEGGHNTIGGAMTAVFAGVIAYKLAVASGFSPDLSAGLSGLAGLAGDELCRSVLNLGSVIKDDPVGFLGKERRKRGDR